MGRDETTVYKPYLNHGAVVRYRGQRFCYSVADDDQASVTKVSQGAINSHCKCTRQAKKTPSTGKRCWRCAKSVTSVSRGTTKRQRRDHISTTVRWFDIAASGLIMMCSRRSAKKAGDHGEPWARRNECASVRSRAKRRYTPMNKIMLPV